MLLIGNKRSHNIATATESVYAPTHTTEISLLICEQMEKADSGSRARDRCPPRNLGGTQPYDIPRLTGLVWTLNSRFDMSDESGGV